jgi:hypothetical protein
MHYPKDRNMKPTQLNVRLLAAAASTLMTLVIFQSVAALALPQPLTPAAHLQPTSLDLTTAMEQP